jgi:hypothetical protein
LESLTPLPVEGVSEDPAGASGSAGLLSLDQLVVSSAGGRLGLSGLSELGRGDDGIGAYRLDTRVFGSGGGRVGLGDSGLSASALRLRDTEIDLFHGVFVVAGRGLGAVDFRGVGVLGNALGVHGLFAAFGRAFAVPGDPAGSADRFCHMSV